VIQRFEPWMALSFTEGSIGGDIEKVNLNSLQAFYGKERTAEAPVQDLEPRGSNGMAIAPSNTTGKHALLLINPHTSFFFRSELQMVSEEGLNAYGAVTWGSSSSTRASTSAPGGCTRRAVWMRWTSTWKR
jgi:acyl-homoserine-lactone acylase